MNVTFLEPIEMDASCLTQMKIVDRVVRLGDCHYLSDQPLAA